MNLTPRFDYAAATRRRELKEARALAFQEVIEGVESAVRFDLYTDSEVIELVREVIKKL